MVIRVGGILKVFGGVAGTYAIVQASPHIQTFSEPYRTLGYLAEAVVGIATLFSYGDGLNDIIIGLYQQH